MPCRSDGFEESDRRRTQAELDRLSQLLCKACGILDLAVRGWQDKHPDLAEWWRKHQAADAKRRAEKSVRRRKDDLRRSGIAKLDPAERKALGL